jgi:hypothetical protein
LVYNRKQTELWYARRNAIPSVIYPLYSKRQEKVLKFLKNKLNLNENEAPESEPTTPTDSPDNMSKIMHKVDSMKLDDEDENRNGNTDDLIDEVFTAKQI